MQAAIPLMIASAVVSAGGKLAEGAQNAATFRLKAHEARAQGVAQETQVRKDARIAMGRQLGSQAESGFAPSTGTALADLEESLINRELDILTTRRNAAAQAAGMEQQAKFAKRSAAFGAVGSILSGAAQVAGFSANMSAAKAG